MGPLLFEAFKDKESYYATVLHELTHWTRHATRLDRDFGRQRFGDPGYAREELVAELGAAFLCTDLGITPEVREDHADYIGHWLEILAEDKHAIFQAAAHAQRAADQWWWANTEDVLKRPDLVNGWMVYPQPPTLARKE
jgi:antirestriction protein ArdC